MRKRLKDLGFTSEFGTLDVKRADAFMVIGNAIDEQRLKDSKKQQKAKGRR